MKLDAEVIIALFALIFSVISLWKLYILQNRHAQSNMVYNLYKEYQEIKSLINTKNKKIWNKNKNPYERLFDLLWLEYKLWRLNLIPGDIFEPWMCNWNNIYKERNEYKQAWEEVKESDSFKTNTGFIALMYEIHNAGNQDIKGILKKYKTKKRN